MPSPYKTAFDTLSYALGQTDEVKGTGVWSAFKLKRDEDEDKDNEEESDNKND